MPILHFTLPILHLLLPVFESITVLPLLHFLMPFHKGFFIFRIDRPVMYVIVLVQFLDLL